MINTTTAPLFIIKVKGAPRPVINYRLSRISPDNPDHLELRINPHLLRSKNPSDYTVTDGNAPYDVVAISEDGCTITVTAS